MGCLLRWFLPVARFPFKGEKRKRVKTLSQVRKKKKPIHPIRVNLMSQPITYLWMQSLSQVFIFLYLFTFVFTSWLQFLLILLLQVPHSPTHPLFLLCFVSIKGRPPMDINQPWYIKYECNFLTSTFVIEIYMRVLMEYHIYQGNTHFSVLRIIGNRTHSQLFRKCLVLLLTGSSAARA